MKLKSIETLDKEEHALMAEMPVDVIKRFKRLEEFTPQDLLAVCLAYPTGEADFELYRERNGMASEHDTVHLVSACSSALTRLVFPFVDFLMADYEDEQRVAAQFGLIMFVTAGLFDRSEMSEEYVRVLVALEDALGYTAESTAL